MNNIQTTGGVFTEEMRKIVYENIIRVFACNEDEIEDLTPVQAWMTNIVLSFKLKGGKYIYWHPGLGSDALVERGRETIMQKVVSDIGIDYDNIVTEVSTLLDDSQAYESMSKAVNPYGDGQACRRIADALAGKETDRYEV